MSAPKLRFHDRGGGIGRRRGERERSRGWVYPLRDLHISELT